MQVYPVRLLPHVITTPSDVWDWVKKYQGRWPSESCARANIMLSCHDGLQYLSVVPSQALC
jgi:hypothetical protein